jgi:hypothetical protein
MAIRLIFVHGWSVTNLDTYGQLPGRLKAECQQAGIDITVQEIFLGQYISFRDEVRLPDISRAFNTAVNTELADLPATGGKFVCITHSTGGPVIRDWWDRYFSATPASCPMSHLIMLAPANFGSALAQLGKGTLSRLKSWFSGVEPGQGVLDWLAVGSAESWALNEKWIRNGNTSIAANGFFPFVLIGQSIDRKLYDNLNSYTGELGSDGVVRSAAANLNGTHITITQAPLVDANGNPSGGDPQIEYRTAPTTAFRIVTGKSHSGPDMGIMNSVQKDVTPGDPSEETVGAIIKCLQVTDNDQYAALCDSFATETAAAQATELVEKVDNRLITLTRRYFIHDKFCMIIFRVRDTEDYPVEDYDLVFTAGELKNANHLPEGFFADRQQNHNNRETVTYFVNYNILNGSPAINADGKTIRNEITGIDRMGISVKPRPDDGFVRYAPLEISANQEFFTHVVKPNSTILIEIRLQRLVSTEVFSLNKIDEDVPDKDFHGTTPGDKIVR